MYRISVTSDIESTRRKSKTRAGQRGWQDQSLTVNLPPAQLVPHFESKPSSRSFRFIPHTNWASDKAISFKSQSGKSTVPVKDHSNYTTLNLTDGHSHGYDLSRGLNHSCGSTSEKLPGESSSTSSRAVKLPENFNKSPKEGISSISNSPTAGSANKEFEELTPEEDVKVDNSGLPTRRKLSLVPPSPRQHVHLLSPADEKETVKSLKLLSAKSTHRQKSTKSQKKVTFSTKKMVMLYDQSNPIPDKSLNRIDCSTRN
jgi:hypothetical protein